MNTKSNADISKEKKQNLLQTIAKFGNPNIQKAVWQILNSFLPYLALWVLMVITVQKDYSYWITLLLTLPAAALLVRIFIIFHDCCHGSFFASIKTNQITGYISGILTFTAFRTWRRSHLGHHANFGDLDRRGTGDVWTLTVEEYTSASRSKRFGYRFYRNPLVLFILGPIYTFFLAQRLAPKDADKRERKSVWITNAALVAIITLVWLTIGIRTYLLIQLPVMILAGFAGVWLFYVQHQYDGVYWARNESWDPLKAALEGSSYYKLPKVLQWCTGNIGLHHIHHLHPRIPNYHLQQCYDEIEELQKIKPLTFRQSLKSVRMNLWDEKRQKLVSFRSLKTLLQTS